MNASNVCVECPVGFYQDDTGMAECEPCPVTHSTKAKGSTDHSDCMRKSVYGTSQRLFVTSLEKFRPK